MKDNKTNPPTKVVIAVDPGECGGIAVFSRSEISTMPLKNGKEALREILFSFSPRNSVYGTVAYMEEVGGFIPNDKGEGQPGSRMFTFGHATGYVHGVLDAYEIPTRLVRPQVWQRGISGRRGDYNSRKKALHAHAKRLFPNLTFTKEEADALGILHYALFAEGISNTGYSEPLKGTADDSAAVAWCRSIGQPVPPYGSPSYAAMVKYWHNEVAYPASNTR